MADISGTNLAAKIVPFTTSDTYPTHDSQYGKGGWHEVATTAERDAITAQRRSAGMAVYVTADSKVYVLGSDLTTWTEFETGKIDKVQKNGTDIPIENKTVNVEVPTKISDLTDDTSTNPVDKADTLTDLTATVTELNYVDGVTSNIQTQLNNKVASNTAITGATKTKITYDSKGLVTAGADLEASDIPNLSLTKITDVTATATELNVLDGITATTTELNYVDGVTSSIQTQLNSKLTTNDIVDVYTSTATNKALSANKGKDLNDRLANVESRGRFLAVWDCVTGLPTTDPTTEGTYTYRTGDYYIVGTVATGTENNYKPNGSGYTKGVASTTIETGDVHSNDTYLYDGSSWVLQTGSTQSVTFASIAGQPTDNTNLATALGAKVTANSDITGATKTKITYDSKGLVTAGADLEASDIPNLTLSKITDVTATASELNVLDGITATTTELNYVDGVTSNIQTQLNNKVAGNTAITGATKTKITYDSKGLVTAGADLTASDIPSLSLSKISDVTATATELNVLDGITATTTELNYVDGVTSNIQTQLNNKVAGNTAITASTTKKLVTYDTKGLVTGGSALESSDVTGALGFTPYNSTNPSGYQTETQVNSAITSYHDTSKVDANTAITGATKTKITYDSKGLVTAGSDLTASDIPNLSLSKITDVTATATELNYMSGVTSNVQTQLNAKAAVTFVDY